MKQSRHSYEMHSRFRDVFLTIRTSCGDYRIVNCSANLTLRKKSIRRLRYSEQSGNSGTWSEPWPSLLPGHSKGWLSTGNLVSYTIVCRGCIDTDTIIRILNVQHGNTANLCSAGLTLQIIVFIY